MDWSTITTAQWADVGVIWLGMVLGKVLSMETRVLTGLLLAALVASANFPVVGLAVIVGAISVKVMMHFTKW